MKSHSVLSNQIVALQPQREQGRTHLFQLHNAEKGQAKKPRTTSRKLAIQGDAVNGPPWFDNAQPAGVEDAEAAR